MTLAVNKARTRHLSPSEVESTVSEINVDCSKLAPEAIKYPLKRKNAQRPSCPIFTSKYNFLSSRFVDRLTGRFGRLRLLECRLPRWTVGSTTTMPNWMPRVSIAGRWTKMTTIKRCCDDCDAVYSITDSWRPITNVDANDIRSKDVLEDWSCHSGWSNTNRGRRIRSVHSNFFVHPKRRIRIACVVIKNRRRSCDDESWTYCKSYWWPSIERCLRRIEFVIATITESEDDRRRERCRPNVERRSGNMLLATKELKTKILTD